MSILRSKLRGAGLAGAATANQQTLVKTGAIASTEAEKATATLTPVKQAVPTNTAQSITGATLTAVPAPTNQTAQVPAGERAAYTRWAQNRYGTAPALTKAGVLLVPVERLAAFRAARVRVGRLAAGAQLPVSATVATVLMPWWHEVDPGGEAAWDSLVSAGTPARTPGTAPLRWPALMAQAVSDAFAKALATQGQKASITAAQAARASVVAAFRPSNLNALIGLEVAASQQAAQQRATIKQVGVLPVITSANQPIPIPTVTDKVISAPKDERIPSLVANEPGVPEDVALDNLEPNADTGFDPGPGTDLGPAVYDQPAVQPAASSTPWLLILGGGALLLLLARK